MDPFVGGLQLYAPLAIIWMKLSWLGWAACEDTGWTLGLNPGCWTWC